MQSGWIRRNRVAKKYRVSELANGMFKLEVLASAPDEEELWVLGSSDTFETHAKAVHGVERLMAKRVWYYSERGKEIKDD